MSPNGTSRTSRDVRLESAKWSKAEIGSGSCQSRFYEYAPYTRSSDAPKLNTPLHPRRPPRTAPHSDRPAASLTPRHAPGTALRGEGMAHASWESRWHHFVPVPLGRAHDPCSKADRSAPDVLEPMRRQLGVAHRVLDVSCDRAKPVAPVCRGQHCRPRSERAGNKHGN
jgi:hypothetical protein